MTDAPDWGEQARRLLTGLGTALGTAPDRDGHGADCRWCPVCQVAAVVRGERPEVSAALADVLSSAAAALRALAEQPPAGGPPDPEAAPAPDEPADAAPAVQRIEIA
jgi:hypothetical protein